MSIKNGKDYIYLIWKDNKTRKQFVVGQLSKNGQFEFEYNHQNDEVNSAIKAGFSPFIPFPDIYKKYKSDILFPAFASRLPDRKRKDIDNILKKYGLEEYDPYKLLKRSGARLPIDNLEFIDPLFDSEIGMESVKRIFNLAGPRHYIGCDGRDCSNSYLIIQGSNLELCPEPTNPYDKNAIRVIWNQEVIGYIPRYYAEHVNEFLSNGYMYHCKVYSFERKCDCNQCISIELNLHKQ